jgi:hypothetical protein
LEKCRYYGRAPWANHARSAQAWADRVFLGLENPFRVHNLYIYPSWLERFRGVHPLAVQQLIADIKWGGVREPLRGTEDIEDLLRLRLYRLGRCFLKAVSPVNGRRLVLSNFALKLWRRTAGRRRWGELEEP